MTVNQRSKKLKKKGIYNMETFDFVVYLSGFISWIYLFLWNWRIALCIMFIIWSYQLTLKNND